ncbi:MaoC/PaaZ C-terminal domain-containing protein [Intrasporangium calvum]|uniref:MaoC/PaaZ C-terminal domain-containing protein n=1 Tax=Intrasporangium calvum TaxID=53358 RepID=A0ABT5GE47_9MICO|nr:MaoC/PaaZ C-terminal domain-containing protein [Intrasporangium calvum]MDC5696518.1 MaoC/PaaZ C-terminal domain-containing protein [Intrasporangium calvum]
MSHEQPARSANPSARSLPEPHYWESLALGDCLVTTGLTITEAHLLTWAGLTGDVVSFHLDAEYAASTQFGHRVAHGPLTLSTSLGLVTQTGYFGNVVAWLGLDSVRAKKPVFIGDTIRVRATIREARETSNPAHGVWVIDYVTSNQHGDVVMTFTSSFLVRRA